MATNPYKSFMSFLWVRNNNFNWAWANGLPVSLQQVSLLFDYPECGMFGLVMGFRRMKCPFSKGLFQFLFNYLTISWSKGSIASSEWVLTQKDERVVLLSFSKRTALSNSLNRNKIPGAEGQLPFLNESFQKGQPSTTNSIEIKFLEQRVYYLFWV